MDAKRKRIQKQIEYLDMLQPGLRVRTFNVELKHVREVFIVLRKPYFDIQVKEWQMLVLNMQTLTIQIISPADYTVVCYRATELWNNMNYLFPVAASDSTPVKVEAVDIDGNVFEVSVQHTDDRQIREIRITLP